MSLPWNYEFDEELCYEFLEYLDDECEDHFFKDGEDIYNIGSGMKDIYDRLLRNKFHLSFKSNGEKPMTLSNVRLKEVAWFLDDIDESEMYSHNDPVFGAFELIRDLNAIQEDAFSKYRRTSIEEFNDCGYIYGVIGSDSVLQCFVETLLTVFDNEDELIWETFLAEKD